MINAIGKKGELIIPGYKFITIWKDMYTVYGGELDWWYGAMGSYVFSNELWNEYHDVQRHIKRRSRMNLTGFFFLKTPSCHGRRSIIRFTGKWRSEDSIRISAVHIPGFLLESDAHRNAAFCIYNAWVTPKLEVRDVKVKNLGGGLKEVTATVENKQMMPTHSGHQSEIQN